MGTTLGLEDRVQPENVSWFEQERVSLTQCASAVLKEFANSNRSGLPPFRLPQLAQKVIAGLIAFVEQGRSEDAASVGSELGQKGLALQSLSALGNRVMQEALSRGAAREQLVVIYAYLSHVTGALVAAEAQDLRHQRDGLQNTLERALRDREAGLRQQLQELSTPIMPIHDAILVLPLIGQIDADRGQKISERLLEEITAQRARIVILDITGVPTVDRNVALGIVRTARAVQLLGARVLLVGVRAEIAATLVQLGAELDGITTLRNLWSGIEYALSQQGYLVQRQEQHKGLAPVPLLKKPRTS